VIVVIVKKVRNCNVCVMSVAAVADVTRRMVDIAACYSFMQSVHQ
jgi:hypothetical protein